MRDDMGAVVVRLILAAALVATGATASRAAPAPASPLVPVELLAETQSIGAGRTFWVALHQEIAPGWHTYWMNPGDSGEPPRIEWTLPAGFTAGEIQWPPPPRLTEAAVSGGRVGPAGRRRSGRLRPGPDAFRGRARSPRAPSGCRGAGERFEGPVPRRGVDRVSPGAEGRRQALVAGTRLGPRRAGDEDDRSGHV